MLRVIDTLDKNIINKLREQVNLQKMDMEYHDILCFLILNGNTVKRCDTATDAISTVSDYLSDEKFSHAVKELLYEELYNSWVLINKSKRPTASQFKSIPEILAWGYDLKRRKNRDIDLDSCHLNKFDKGNLSAFWEAIKFSQVKSLRGIRGFGDQSPESWKISCAGIVSCNLLSFTFGGPDYLSNVSVDMWRLFWESITSSKIEDLDLCFIHVTHPPTFGVLWDIMCDGLRYSKIKSLSLERMDLNKLNREQWIKLYRSLSQIKLESLNLTCNHLYGLATNQQDALIPVDDESQGFDIVCDIIGLPSLRQIILREDHFERIPTFCWSVLCDTLGNSHLEYLDIRISNDKDLSTEGWHDFINALMKVRLKTLKLQHCSPTELTPAILKAFCEMVERSQLESVAVHLSFKGFSLQAQEWKMLGVALKNRAIRTFDFGWLETSDNNLIDLFEAARIADIETIHMQNGYLGGASPELWEKLPDVIKKTKISTLDIRRDLSMTRNLVSWSGFCNMILTSGIKTLYFDVQRYDELSQQQLILFCNMIRNGCLETLVLDFNSTLSKMSLDNFKMLFEAINRSNITCLPYHLNEYDLWHADRREIVSNTLQIIENRAKYKGTLLGLCAATLFNRLNAVLTDTGVAYEDETRQWEAKLSDGEKGVLKQFI